MYIIWPFIDEEEILCGDELYQDLFYFYIMYMYVSP